MNAISRHRWIIVAITNYVILFFVGQANFYLAPLGLHIFIIGMLVAYSGMELSFYQGLFSILPIAFHLDSKSPLPFGFNLLLFLALFALTFAARRRLRREVSASALVCSLTLNLIAFGAYTAGTLRYLGSESFHITPASLNLFVSALAVFLGYRLFFAMHTGMLALFGVRLAEEHRDAR